jgi:DHA1 family multidrug resistance protein-like MFS transporter
VAPPAPAAPGSTVRRLRPMLLAVVLTMTAEAAVGLLLLLHLQRRFDLEIIEIAYVFLPGAIVMALLPTRLHRFVLRYGRTRVLAVASVSSAVFAASLAWAPNPWVIAVLWILSGVAWAAVIPVQQAVIAEASGARVGRGMGAYEAAVLLGGLIGSLAAGVLYDAGPWALACALSAAVILSGAVLVPWSVRAVGVADFPAAPPVIPSETPPTPVSPPRSAPAAELDPARRPAPTAGRSAYRKLAEHAGLFTAAQVVLVFLAESWLLDLARGDADLLNGTRAGGASFLYGAGRIWTLILLVDVVWTVVAARRATGPGRGRAR